MAFVPSVNRPYTLQDVVGGLIAGQSNQSSPSTPSVQNNFILATESITITESVSGVVSDPVTWDSGAEWVQGLWT